MSFHKSISLTESQKILNKLKSLECGVFTCGVDVNKAIGNTLDHVLRLTQMVSGQFIAISEIKLFLNDNISIFNGTNIRYKMHKQRLLQIIKFF